MKFLVSRKKFLKGKHFSTDKEVKKVVKDKCYKLDRNFGNVYKLPERWQK